MDRTFFRNRTQLVAALVCGMSVFANSAFVLPVHSKRICFATLAGLGLANLALLGLARHRKWVRLLVILCPVFVVLFLLIPGRPLDPASLQKSYIQQVAAFEGTKYLWGGESHLGIDCSGLPRRAYRDALLREGLRTANPAALRAFLEQWYFDASAKALGEGYRDYTVDAGLMGTVASLDPAQLNLGDMAITRDGVHALVYVGEGKWSQADPSEGKVITLDAQTDSNPWFSVPVRVVSWTKLRGKVDDRL